MPCGHINSIDKLYDDPQVKHLGLRHPVTHKTLGDMDLLPQGVKLSKHDPKTGMATPDRGEHTSEILKEYGFDDDQIKDFVSRVVV